MIQYCISVFVFDKYIRKLVKEVVMLNEILNGLKSRDKLNHSTTLSLYSEITPMFSRFFLHVRVHIYNFNNFASF